MRFAALALCLGGCLSLRPSQTEGLTVQVMATQAQCAVIDRDVMGWTATAVALGVLGGGSGVTSLLTDSTARYAVGGVGIGLSTLSAVATYLSTAYAQIYAKNCTVNVGGQ